jgi:hypothetical protein
MQRFFLAAAVLALLAGSALAQSPGSQSIEVRGSQPVRTDVRALCPAIDNALHDALVKTVQEVATAAVIDVRFQLAGSRIDSVATGAGPVRYQRALKRAVRGRAADGGAARALRRSVRPLGPARGGACGECRRRAMMAVR